MKVWSTNDPLNCEKNPREILAVKNASGQRSMTNIHWATKFLTNKNHYHWANETTVYIAEHQPVHSTSRNVTQVSQRVTTWPETKSLPDSIDDYPFSKFADEAFAVSKP